MEAENKYETSSGESQFIKRLQRPCLWGAYRSFSFRTRPHFEKFFFFSLASDFPLSLAFLITFSLHFSAAVTHCVAAFVLRLDSRFDASRKFKSVFAMHIANYACLLDYRTATQPTSTESSIEAGEIPHPDSEFMSLTRNSIIQKYGQKPETDGNKNGADKNSAFSCWLFLFRFDAFPPRLQMNSRAGKFPPSASFTHYALLSVSRCFPFGSNWSSLLL